MGELIQILVCFHSKPNYNYVLQTDRQTDISDLRDNLGNRQVMRGYHGTIPQSWVRIHSIVSGSQVFVNLQSL